MNNIKTPSLRRVLAYAISFSISFGSVPRVWAGPGSDANDKLDASYDGARLLAKNAFMQILKAKLDRATPLNFAVKRTQQMIVDFNQNLEEIADPTSEKSKFRVAYNTAMMGSADIEDLLESDGASQRNMIKAITRFVDSYRNMVTTSESFAHNIRSKQQVLSEAQAFAPDFIGEINELCQKGVALYYVSPNLSRISYSSPQMQLKFYANADQGKNPSRTSAGLDQDDNVYGIMMFPLANAWGKDGRKYNAALTYGTLAGTGLGLAAATSLTGLALALATSGITIAIAIVVMAVQTIMQNDEARRQADAVERVFWERADSETVRHMVMNECKAVQPRFQAIPAIVDGLNRSDPKVLAEFTPLAERADALNKKISDLMEKVSQKREALIAKQTQDRNPPNDEQINSEVRDSREMSELKDYIKAAGTDAIINQLIVNLTRFAQKSANADLEFEQLAKTELESQDSLFQNLQSQLPGLIERRNKVFELARSIGRSSISPDYIQQLRISAEDEKKVASLYKEWEIDYVAAVKNFLVHGSASSAIEELIELNSRIKEYAASSKAGAPILNKLVNRSNSIVAILGEAKS